MHPPAAAPRVSCFVFLALPMDVYRSNLVLRSYSPNASLVRCCSSRNRPVAREARGLGPQPPASLGRDEKPGPMPLNRSTRSASRSSSFILIPVVLTHSGRAYRTLPTRIDTRWNHSTLLLSPRWVSCQVTSGVNCHLNCHVNCHELARIATFCTSSPFYGSASGATGCGSASASAVALETCVCPARVTPQLDWAVDRDRDTFAHSA